MQERVELAGGIFHVTAQPNQGDYSAGRPIPGRDKQTLRLGSEILEA